MGNGTCFSRIRSLSDENSRAMKRIGDYVMAHKEEVVNLTISELAKRAGTGIATVSRFCTRLRYDNYRAFQVDLSASLVQMQSPISDVFLSIDDPSTMIRRVFELNRRSLIDTEALTRHEHLIEVARLLTRARRIYLMGIGGSGLVARMGALRFESLGLMALAITDPYEGLLVLSAADGEDVAVGISHTGRSALVVKLMRLARENGARTVGLTNYADSTLAEACEFPLITSFRERRVNAAVSSSRIAQLCVLDAIYFLVAYFIRPRAEKLALESEEIAEDLFRADSSRRGGRTRGEPELS